MIKLLILSGFIGIVCVKIHGMSFMKKLAVKIVMVYGMLGWVGLGFALLLFSMTELYEGKYGNSRRSGFSGWRGKWAGERWKTPCRI